MNRTALLALVGLGLFAVLSLVNLGVAASNWTAVWRGLDQITMELGDIWVSESRDRVDVEFHVSNGSGRPLTLRQIDGWARLSGRSIGGGTERFSDLVLAPGERARVVVENRVTPPDRAYVGERIDAGDASWVVGGRVSVVVDDLTDPIWLPFQWRVDQP
jgi:hypothetical protein